MEVRVEKLDNFGRGIAYIENKICFIENALPDELVEMEITRENKKYKEARVIQYLEKSPHRIDEECPYSSICGGCNLNHFCFNDENRFKREKVRDLLVKYAHISPEKIEAIAFQERNHYRNKITLHGREGEMGLYKKDSNEVIPIAECLLVNGKINEIIRLLNSFQKDIQEVVIKTSNDNSQVMVSITGKIERIEELQKHCNVLIINGNYVTQEKEIVTATGSKRYYEGISSFFQVNNTLTKDLYEEVLKEVKKGQYENVLDLYCGTGTIGIYISDYCKKITGIDYNPSNISDANKNKTLNQATNIEFICDKVENKIDSFQNVDLVVVDPPRAGLDEKTRDYLKKIAPQKIIYVSCDPVTLARDLKDLQTDYEVERIKPFNMFPRTYHVECVTILERK